MAVSYGNISAAKNSLNCAVWSLCCPIEVQIINNPNLFPGPNRCFPFWQEVLACYVLNADTEDGKGKAKCKSAVEDYYECLNHKKEVRMSPHLYLAYRH